MSIFYSEWSNISISLLIKIHFYQLHHYFLRKYEQSEKVYWLLELLI